MHRHNPDLITALAEGILAAGLAAEAEAEIAACADCAADLARQRVALDALRALPPAEMTAAEAADLRTAVAGALGISDPVPAPRTAPARPRRTAWTVIAAAAGLAAVLAVVPVIGLITTGNGGDDAAMTVALESGTNDTTEDLRGDPGADPGDAGLSLTSPAGADPEAAEAPATTDAAAPTAVSETSTTVAGLEESGEIAAYAAPVVEGDAAIREMFEAGPEAAPPAEHTERATAACSAEAEQQLGNDVVLVNVAATLDDGRPVVLFATGDWSVMVAFDPDDCGVALRFP